ncbi:hypothetical protein ACTMU2_23495 [Cupriavidus basilensis]
MAEALAATAQANGVKTMGFIGFADAYSETWLEPAGMAAAGPHGVLNYSAQGHYGLDQRGRIMLTIENGNWNLLK